MSFARGAQLQQQSGHGQDSIGGSISHGPSRIREVWKTNLGQEMAMIRNLIDRYPYVSMVRISTLLLTIPLKVATNSIFNARTPSFLVL